MDLINTSERNWDDTPVEIPPEVVQTIIAGIERLQHEQFHNTTTVIPTITFDSLLLNHRASNSDYPNETLAEFGPEFPTVELGAEFDGDQAPSGCDIELPKTNLNRVMYSNVREYGTDLYAEICPTSNNCGSGVEENSTITAIRIQLQQQREKFLALQENMLGLNGQIKQRYETILEFPRQLNTEHEFHRLNVPTIDQQLQLPLQTKVYQVPTSEHFDGTHSEIAETITTNQLSSLRYSGRTEQFQEIDILHSSTGDVTRSEDDAELHCESEHPTPSYQEDSFNLSEESFRMKQVRSDQIRKVETETSTRKPRDSPKRSKIYTCGECKKEFNWKGSLTVHLRIHSGEKPHKCKHCNSAFSQPGDLKKHQLVHSGERPYKCKDCNSAFSRSSGLKTHQRVHTGERPYKCKYCNSAFSQSSGLIRHQVVHSNERPFICNICQKPFPLKDYLKAHLQIHSSKKTHKCNECEKEFTFRCNLTQHLQIHSKKKVAQP